ncbi:MAG: DUF2089 domain-containing protein [Candidatus Eisenbacteria bacterium]|nr:DUF2089 domain-containing protein [Candidatus Eisenbacteria bacterium]
MIHKQPGQCPVCGGDMVIKELECPTCQVTVSGSFETCPFCILTAEQLELIKIFLKSRGNIKEVERELGISYPTVRGRLDDIVRTLGFTPPQPEVTRGMKDELLAKLESGEINADEFVRKLDEASA